MAGVRKRGKTYYGYFYGIKDGKKKRIDFKGTASKTETLNIARMKEDEHRRILLGYKEAPAIAERHKETAYAEIVAEYIAWGEAQGGRNGYPWNNAHANRVHSQLERFWPKALSLEIMGDLYGIVPGVEKAIQQLIEAGKNGKTINLNIGILKAFCNWCIERDYLTDNQLKKVKPVKEEASFNRRAVTMDELHRIVGVITANTDLFGYWQVLLPVACCMGIRSNAIKNLTVDDINLDKCQLRLQAKTAKNRKESVKAISAELAGLVLEYYRSGKVQQLYDKYYSRKDANKLPPKGALIYVPSHPARELDKILMLAGIEKENTEGRIDFHALRKAYATFIIESGANPKEAQAALDHSDPRITFNTYAQVRQDNMHRLADKVTKPVLDMFSSANTVPTANHAGKEKTATSDMTDGCGDALMVVHANLRSNQFSRWKLS